MPPFVFEVVQPFGLVQFLDPPATESRNSLVDAEPLRFVLVAEEEVGVLPAVALRGRRLGAEEAELVRAFADRVVALEQLHVAGPHVVFDQAGDRAEEVLAAAGALQVVEDLDRDRRVGGAEPVAFLRDAAEDFLRFGDAGDADDVAAGLLGGDIDDRVAERSKREAEGEDYPEPAPAGDRHGRGSAPGSRRSRASRHYRGSARGRSRNCGERG